LFGKSVVLLGKAAIVLELLVTFSTKAHQQSFRRRFGKSSIGPGADGPLVSTSGKTALYLTRPAIKVLILPWSQTTLDP